MDVGFCNLTSLGQLGSNKNTNGLLREHFSTGTDLSTLTLEDKDRPVASSPWLHAWSADVVWDITRSC